MLEGAPKNQRSKQEPVHWEPRCQRLGTRGSGIARPYLSRSGREPKQAAEPGGFLITRLLKQHRRLLIADLLWQLGTGLDRICASKHSRRRIGATPSQLSPTAASCARCCRCLPATPLPSSWPRSPWVTILAGLGVQIVPLIAGAGIFGIAIGFGSQETLVKDVPGGRLLHDGQRLPG